MLRKHPRFAVDIETAGGKYLVRDISFGGMRVLSDTRLHIDDVLCCELETEHGIVSLEGKVAWARRSGREVRIIEYGVELETAAGEASLRLRLMLYDLSASGAEQKEGSIDHLEVERLKDRVAELEDQSDASGERNGDAELGAESGDGATLTEDDEGDEETRMLTRFDSDRFTHLIQLGQPLLVLVDNPADKVEGPALEAVTAAFSSRFDLTHVQEVVGKSLREEAIMRSLYVCYQRDLIDFA
ncbi:MAG: PilZ domain-containing protein [bacterium]|nr:PilZ domain-containing protein [bacterium]